MSWVGIGLIARSSSPMLGLNTVAFLRPSRAWDGTAASGFDGLPPADPERITAKPALRLITPPNQHFTNTLLVGVTAMANETGTLINNFGIASVTFLYEGNEVVADQPHWQIVDTERGPRLYFGWWVRLQKIIGLVGKGHLYVKATAHDETMQERVIGPYNFSPVDQLYDLDLKINPDLEVIAGERYQDLFAAASYARVRGAHNPRFLITKPGKYQLTESSSVALSPSAYDITGRYTIEASVLGVLFGRNAYTSDGDAIIASLQTYWRLKGSNLTFDTFNVRYWGGLTADWDSLNPGHWLDGVDVTTTSPGGKNDMMRGGLYDRGATIVAGLPWLTEVNFKDQNTPACDVALVRGCHFENSSQDLISNSLCVVHNTFDHSDQAFWNGDAAAFTVTPPAGDTLERAGGNNGSGSGGGVWTATVSGVPYTFDVGNGGEDYYLYGPDGGYNGASGVGGYWCGDVVDWLNSLPGWEAELSPEFAIEDRRGSCLSRPGRKGQGFTIANGRQITGDGTTAFEIVWTCDTHGDLYQHTSGVLENVIVAFNRGWDLEVQCIFLSPILQNGVAATRDVFFVGNAFSIHPDTRLYYNPEAIASSIRRPQDVSHLVICHNTLTNQRFLANFNADGPINVGYNLIGNNAFRSFEWSAGEVIEDIVDGLLIHEDQIIPDGVKNYIAAGSAETLYTDPFNGDFTPTALMRELGFVPKVPVDLFQAVVPDPCAPGAIAAEADELQVAIEPPPPVDVLGEAGLALANAIDQRVHGGMWLFTTATNPGLWAASNLAGSADRFIQGSAAYQPAITDDGAVFGDDDQIDADFFAGDYTLYVLLKKNAASTVGQIILNDVIYSTGSSSVDSANGGVVFVDGDAISTRDQMFVALDAEVEGETIWREVRVQQAGIATLSLGRAAGSAIDGTIMAVAAVPEFGYDPVEGEDPIEGPTLAEMRALARAWMRELVPELDLYPEEFPPPGVTLRGASTGSVASGTTLTLAPPTGTATGDLLTAVIQGLSTDVFSAPAGWNTVSTGTASKVFQRLHNGSANYTFTTAVSGAKAGIMTAHQNGVLGVAGAWTANAESNPIPPSITVPAGGNMVMTFAGSNLPTTTWTAPLGWTLLAAVTTDRSLAVFTRDNAAPGGVLVGVPTPRVLSGTGRAAMIGIGAAD